MLYEERERVRTTKNSSLSLKDLLSIHFPYDSNKYHDLKMMMKTDSSFWGQRPLTEKMLSYAVEDVLFLEKLYWIFKKECDTFNKNTVKQNLWEKIFSDSQYSIPYTSLNLNIEKFQRKLLLENFYQTSYKKGDEKEFLSIKGMLK